jgi:hypothetical protein
MDYIRRDCKIPIVFCCTAICNRVTHVTCKMLFDYLNLRRQQKWRDRVRSSEKHCTYYCYYYYYYYYYYYPCCHLYAVYLQLHTWNKPHFYGIHCYSCSVFTVCATCNVISPVKYVLYFIHQHFPQYMCVQCTIWLFFHSTLIFALSPVRCSGTVWVIFKWFQSPAIITGITFAVTLHMRCIYIVRSL